MESKFKKYEILLFECPWAIDHEKIPGFFLPFWVYLSHTSIATNYPVSVFWSVLIVYYFLS